MIFLLLSVAMASPAYPSAIATDLSTPCTPACTVCHQSNAGGNGTATQPFATAMQARGLIGGSNTTGLQTALTAMATDQVDSNGDGVIDTEELAAGVDPNTGADFCSTNAPTPPHYGCGPSSSAAFLLCGTLLSAGALRRSLRGR